MPASSITTKGQTTIPKAIRDRLHLKAGDVVEYVIDEDGKVVLAPATMELSELQGILHRPGMKAVSMETMKKVIKERAGGQ